jgi:hypothetical protein
VQVRAADVVQVHLPDDAHPERGEPPPVVVQSGGLQHHHVAAVAPAIEKAPCRCGRGHGRHDLEERVADRHHRVHQSELGDTRVAKRHLDAEDARQCRDRCLEITGGNDHLAESHGHKVDRDTPWCQ